MPLLHEWETFYMIVGSAAAALTGLQFVVIALTAQRRAVADPKSLEAFGTPTIVHFCVVLTIAAVVVMPHETSVTLAAAFVTLGIAGVVYALVTARRTKRQTGYVPVLEDWLWHAGFPLLSYAALFATGIAATTRITGALYSVAIIALVLLFIGIHNAWDSAIYVSTLDGERD